MLNGLLRPALACAVVCALANVCFGRLGETEAELEARYGKAIRVEPKPQGDYAPAEKRLCFVKNGVSVSVLTLRGRSVREDYGFSDKDGKPSSVRDNLAKAEVLLDTNGQGAAWQARPVPPLFQHALDFLWVRSDGKAKANVFKAEPHVLRVIDDVFVDEANNSDTQQSIGLGGF